VWTIRTLDVYGGYVVGALLHRRYVDLLH
jgi:hypothetical protein